MWIKNCWWVCAVAVLWAELERTAFSTELEVSWRMLSVKKLDNIYIQKYMCVCVPLLLKLDAFKPPNCSLFKFKPCRPDCGNTLSYLLHTGSHMGQCTISPINYYQDRVWACTPWAGAICNAPRYTSCSLQLTNLHINSSRFVTLLVLPRTLL